MKKGAQIVLRCFVFLGTSAVALIAIIMAMDALSRRILGVPLPGSLEMIETAMAISVFSLLPLVTARTQHIAFDAFEWQRRDPWRSKFGLFSKLLSSVTWAGLAIALIIKGIDLQRYGDASSELGISQGLIAFFMSAGLVVSAIMVWVQVAPADDSEEALT